MLTIRPLGFSPLWQRTYCWENTFLAVALWKKFGFEIIGTTPKGFRHPQLGLVDTYIMYLALGEN